MEVLTKLLQNGSCYTFIDYQLYIQTRSNLYFIQFLHVYLTSNEHLSDMKTLIKM